MRILVVGGSGFLGKSFLLKSNLEWECFATYSTSSSFPHWLKLENLKHVTPIHLPLSSKEKTIETFERIGKDFDVCLYAMGNSNISESTKSPLIDINSNIIPLVNLLGTIRLKKLIFISSGSVYEGYSQLVNPTLPVSPTIPYSISKLTSERIIAHFQKNTDNLESFVCLRFFGAYGPLEPQRKIYTKLIRTFSLRNESAFKLNGNGKNYIDAMYIDDTIDGILSVINSDKGNKIVDFCFGEPLTLNELVSLAANVFKKTLVLEHIGSTPEYTTFYASPKEMKALFGFEPKIRLEEGLLRFKKYLALEALKMSEGDL